MKHLWTILLLALACCPSNARAQIKIIGETEAKWPGLHFQIFWLERVPPNRLAIGVRILATPQAPAGGTLIGYPVPIPAGLTPEQIAAGDFVPKPFSLASSVMVDEITQEQYPTLPNISPPGKQYYPSQGQATLKPGQIMDFIIQFKIPPPPPPEEGKPPVKQTLSFLFTNANGAIKNISIPPPASSPP